MNTKHFQLLYDAISNAPEEKFGMCLYFYDKTEPHPAPRTTDPQSLYACNTAACIFGWAAFISDYQTQDETNPLNLHNHVCDFLEISSNDGAFIAEGYWSDKPLQNITKIEALEYLSKVIETGEIRHELED